MTIQRTFSMPNKWTFQMRPVKDLLNKYVHNLGAGWVDPFCGNALVAQFRNDLNPSNLIATHHMDAVDFVKTVEGPLAGCLIDPPYSPTQIAKVYKNIGRKPTRETTQNARLYARVKDALAPKIQKGGYAICCGWNSTGMGRARGFELVEMLVVNHGAAHNDTIVTVEVKA